MPRGVRKTKPEEPALLTIEQQYKIAICKETAEKLQQIILCPAGPCGECLDGIFLPPGRKLCEECSGAGNVGHAMTSDNMDMDFEQCETCDGKGFVSETPQEVLPATPSGQEPEEAAEPESYPADQYPKTAVVHVEYPEKKPWGWWTAWEEQQRFVDELHHSTPMPRDILPPDVSTLTPADLQNLLQRFGGALTNLYAQYGILEGKAHALDATFRNAMTAAKFKAEQRLREQKVPRADITEGRKEQEALSDPDIGEALREVKRRSIEMETCVPVVKRYIDAYEIAWRTVSRQMTGQQAEMEIERSGRSN